MYNGESLEPFSSRPTFQPVLLPNIKALSESLAQKVAESRDNFLNRIRNAIGPLTQPTFWMCRTSGIIGKERDMEWGLRLG